MAFPWNPNESLGLPKGSVRAILVMMLTFGYFYMHISGIAVPAEYQEITFGALGLYVLPRVLGETGDFLTARRPPVSK